MLGFAMALGHPLLLMTIGSKGLRCHVLCLLGLHHLVPNRRHPGCHSVAHLKSRMWVFVQWSIEIRHNLKKDSFSVVEGMRIQPVEKSSMRIPLCRLVHMPLVRPTLRSDVTKLMAAFQFGYRAGSATLYVSTTNESWR